MSGSVARPINGRLAQVRAKLGMDKGQFADFLGVHRNTYRSWEAQQSDVGVEALVATAAAGWNTNWLLTGEGPEKLASIYAFSDTEKNSQAEGSPPSHQLIPETLTIAMELADKILGDRWLPKPVYSTLAGLMYEALQEGRPYGDILREGMAIADRLFGGSEIGSDTTVGAPSRGSADAGTPAPGQAGRSGKKRKTG